MSNEPNITTPSGGELFLFTAAELADPASVADPERRARLNAPLAESPDTDPEAELIRRHRDGKLTDAEEVTLDAELAATATLDAAAEPLLQRVAASAGYRALADQLRRLQQSARPVPEAQLEGIDQTFAELLAAESARDEADRQPVFSDVYRLLAAHGPNPARLRDPAYVRRITRQAVLAARVTDASAVLDDAALETLPEPAWRLDGILPADSGVVLYGRRATYKTFVLLDWGLSIQTGTDWLGHAVAPGQFVYVAAEGWGGLKRRVKAWKLAHDVDARVGACFVKGSSLRTDAAVDRLIARIQAQVGTAPVALIGLDTLNRLIPGIEENAPEAMGRAVGIADRLRAAFPKATVVWVHHSGWEDKHERGHSSLGDDLDVIIHAEAALEPKVVELSCEKQKDADEFTTIRVAAVAAAESLVLEAAAAPGAGPGATLNETEAAVLPVLVSLSPGGEHVQNTVWFEACGAQPVRVRGKVIERRTFNNARQGLLKKGRVEGDTERGFRPLILSPQG